MKKANFKFDTNHALILLAVIFISSIIYLFISSGQKARGNISYEFFTTKEYNIEYYYIQNCPHCVEFDDIWTEVSTMPSLIQKVDFQKLEISKNIEKASKFNIRSAPTIVAVRIRDRAVVGTLQSDSRSKAGFIAFVQKYT